MPRVRTAIPPEGERSPGFHKPTTTPVPDELFDEWLAVLSGAELKCLLYIVRRTLGFKKDIDAISLSQMVSGITTRDGRVLDRGTGLNRSTVVEALASLEARGLINVRRAADAQGAALTSTYALRWRGDDVGNLPPPQDNPVTVSNPRQRKSSALIAAPSETAISLETMTPTLPVVEPEGGETALGAGVVVKSDYGTGTDDQNPRQQDAPTLPDRPVVGKNNQGSRKNRRGWLDNPPTLVGESNSQQTVQETVINKDDSNRLAGKERKPTYSPYIAGIVIDHSRELGDALHAPANVTQALRIWASSGRAEEDFVTMLHEARRLVRTYQGKQGAVGLTNRMAYFFRVLEDLASKGAE